MTLNQLQAGDSGHISDLSTLNQCIYRQCLALGLCQGAYVEVLHRSRGNGPMQIKCSGTLYAIRPNEAESIHISRG